MRCAGNSSSDNSYCGEESYDNRNGSSFARIVVLFILLIIISATFMNKEC